MDEFVIVDCAEEELVDAVDVKEPQCGGEEPQYGGDVIEVDSQFIESEEVWLRFPFVAGDQVERAAKGLSLCDPMSTYNTSDLITMQLVKSVVIR